MALAHLIPVKVSRQSASLTKWLVYRVPILKAIVPPDALLQAEYRIDNNGCTFDDHPDYHAIYQGDDTKYKKELREDIKASYELKHYHRAIRVVVIVLVVSISTLILRNIVEPQLLRDILVDVDACSVESK